MTLNEEALCVLASEDSASQDRFSDRSKMSNLIDMTRKPPSQTSSTFTLTSDLWVTIWRPMLNTSLIQGWYL